MILRMQVIGQKHRSTTTTLLIIIFITIANYICRLNMRLISIKLQDL